MPEPNTPNPPSAAGVTSTAKKIPLWGWAVVIGAGLMIGILLRQKQQDKKAAAAASVDPAGETATGTDAFDTGYGTAGEGNLYAPDETGVLASAGPTGAPSVILLPSPVGAPTTATGTSATGEDSGQGVTGGTPAPKPADAHVGYAHDHKHPPAKKPPKGYKWFYGGMGIWTLIPTKPKKKPKPPKKKAVHA